MTTSVKLAAMQPSDQSYPLGPYLFLAVSRGVRHQRQQWAAGQTWKTPQIHEGRTRRSNRQQEGGVSSTYDSFAWAQLALDGLAWTKPRMPSQAI